ncbi:hypothetical protein MBRA1_002386 [Malassezia brasiliensis]|uniref:Uncharacterized protein n=1 Tax=Malassezia brasiliensis TaxID=1821822 RepID=A0AAF0IP68_9BASI|nr:hypothetical protein MBRA1_002386 [Malassezia brasiliensis]
MSPSPTPRRFHLPRTSHGAWVALYPDYDDIETGVHVYQRKTGWWDAALLRLPASVRWFLTQRYQLRISWPANVPATFTIDVHTSDMLGGERAPEPKPCELLLVQITAHATGVPLHTTPPRTRSVLLGLAERIAGWAAPSAVHDAEPLVFDLTFEHVYLGAIPSSSLWMIAYAVLALGAAHVVFGALVRRLALFGPSPDRRPTSERP